MFVRNSLTLLSLALANHVRAEINLRVVSFNIRYSNDNLEVNELPWWTKTCQASPGQNECRRYHAFNTLGAYINNASPDQPETAIAGLQEVMSNQLGDVLWDFDNTKWASIGVGRKDGDPTDDQGEYNPIIYNVNVLEKVFDTTKWLSLTPDEPGSQSWGSGSDRIVTIGVFKHKLTGESFIAANTHLDNASDEARVEQIKVAVAEIEKVQAVYGVPAPLGVTLTGDFNSDPNGNAYKTLEGLNYLTDSWNTAPRQGSNQLTYTGFQDNLGGSKIDFVWYGANSDNLFVPNKTEIVSNKVGDTFMSDHRLIYTDFTLYPAPEPSPVV